MTFPAIPGSLSCGRWSREEGPAFVGDPSIELESGPGPVPALVEDQAHFICWDQREALQRVHLSYSAGFWARIAIETFITQVSPSEVSGPPQHFIVLRVSGIGGFVRFASPEHFNHFLAQVFEGGLLYHSFATEIELEVFCQGAKIAVPPLFEPC